MTLDARLIPRVYSIVQKYGKTVTFQKTIGGAYDPTTGAATSEGTSTTFLAKVTPPQDEVIQDSPGGTDARPTIATRIYLPAQGLAFTPEANMNVVIDGVTFRVLSVSPVYSGELIALYGLSIAK